MLIPLQQILDKYKFQPTGVIHVGAHWAEEHNDYIKAGIIYKTYIEPCKEAFDIMVRNVSDYLNTVCYNYACGSENTEMEINVSHNNQGQSNSLLKPLLHLQQHPSVVFTEKELVKVSTLDNLPMDRSLYDFLVMDCQGYEGEVLKGATKTLEGIKMIYTECNRGQTYENNMEIEEMDEYLKQFNFSRVETYWPSPNWTWGDCIFIKNSL